jgi:hypothetical protein
LIGVIMKTRHERADSPLEDAPAVRRDASADAHALDNVRRLRANPTSDAWRIAMAVATATDGHHGADDVVPLVHELDRLQGQLDDLGTALEAERRDREALEGALAEAREAAESARLRNRVIEDEALLLLGWLNASRRIKKRELPARIERLQEAFRGLR